MVLYIYIYIYIYDTYIYETLCVGRPNIDIDDNNNNK